MLTYLIQLAPQRSTQYSDLVNALAAAEFVLGAGNLAADVMLTEVAGRPYLRFSMADPLTGNRLREIGLMATVSALFECVNRIGDQSGPLLRPIDITPRLLLPPEMVMSRRYRGKTNELFTHFLCNIARYSSTIRDHPWDRVRVFDPLAGGGTTLLTALTFGADVAGVERREQDVSSTVNYLRRFLQEERIGCQTAKSRLKKLGKRWVLSIGRNPAQKALLAAGDTADAVALLDGFRPHLIVTDLPYGIQHQGQLTDLLARALPVWSTLLPVGGVIVFAWDATRLPRDKMIRTVESAADLTVLNHPPYNQLVHRVDRVIKRRDVVVARGR